MDRSNTNTKRKEGSCISTKCISTTGKEKANEKKNLINEDNSMSVEEVEYCQKKHSRLNMKTDKILSANHKNIDTMISSNIRNVNNNNNTNNNTGVFGDNLNNQRSNSGNMRQQQDTIMVGRSRKIDYDPLVEYERSTMLGQGTYGTVWACYKKSKPEELLAMKRIKLEASDGSAPATALREIGALRELERHPNIVKLKTVIQSHEKLTLIFPFHSMDLKKLIDYRFRKKLPPETDSITVAAAAGGNGGESLNQRSNIMQLGDSSVFKEGFSEGVRKGIMKQLLYGIAYSHHKKILHRDIKPGNIFCDLPKNMVLNAEYCPKVIIGDYGLVRNLGVPCRSLTHSVVSLWYRSAEVILGAKYSASIDVYALGLILYELYVGKPLFVCRNENELLLKIFRIFGTPKPKSLLQRLPKYEEFDFPIFSGFPPSQIIPNANEFALDLFMKLCSLEPNDRITAAEALNHPWFTHGDPVVFPIGYSENYVIELLNE